MFNGDHSDPTMIIRRLIMKNKQGQVLSTGKTGTKYEIKLGSKKTFNPIVKKQNVGETNHVPLRIGQKAGFFSIPSAPTQNQGQEA